MTYAEAKSLGIAHLFPGKVRKHAEESLRGAIREEVPPGVGLRMNKTESRFADMLDRMKAEGSIKDWTFEAEKFRLADKTWFLPDFRLLCLDGGTLFVEVKARDRNGKVLWKDDAAVKCKTVAEIHPYPFYLASYGSEGWDISRLPSRNFGWIDFAIEWPF